MDTTVTPGAPTRGSKAYLTQRVQALNAKARQLRDDRANLEAENRQLRRERDALTDDLNRIAKALLREANRRSWCRDYELFAGVMNRRTSKPWLLSRDYEQSECQCEMCVRDRAAIARSADTFTVTS